MKVPFECQFVVDCEYSSETHELISMAIVPLWPKDSSLLVYEVPEKEFYEVLSPLPIGMSDWVKENVLPHLAKPGIPLILFQEKLQSFLQKHNVQELHYDWCDDIAYFNRIMITGPGKRIDIPGKILGHIHHPDIEYHSEENHNALHDARAIAAAIRHRIVKTH